MRARGRCGALATPPPEVQWTGTPVTPLSEETADSVGVYLT
jgi:hypothetical protein